MTIYDNHEIKAEFKKEINDSLKFMVQLLISEKRSLRVEIPITQETIIFYYDPETNSVTEYGVDQDGLDVTPEKINDN